MTKAISKEYYDNLKEKQCSKCKLILSTDNFRRRKDRPSHPYSSSCRVCDVKKTQKYNKENNYDAKAANRRLKYNISNEEYEKILISQNYVCKICNRPETRLNANKKVASLSIDHCHTTGMVRGLLCNDCNVAIGLVKENLTTLDNMIAYLQYFRSSAVSRY